MSRTTAALGFAATIVMLMAGSLAAQAQENWPSRPIRIIVPYPAGGIVDIVARAVTEQVGRDLKATVIVEARPGGNSNIGTEAVIRAPGDGYSLLLANSVNAINASLYQRLSYNFLRDIAPVAGISETPLVMLVHQQFPAKSVPEFLAYAKPCRDRALRGTRSNGRTKPRSAREWFGRMSSLIGLGQ